MKMPYLLILLVIGFLPLVDLLTPGIPLTHDGPDHVARIANFYRSLSEGNIVPRWAENLNWGYGHPILMFLYPLPSYFSSLFHFFGFSLTDSVKLVFAASYLASIGAFYLWASRQWNKTAGFVGALLYGFAPYRFVDLYVRGALGEHVAFVFPPLVFWGLWSLAKREHYRLSTFAVSLGIAGLLLSHNALSLMFLPLIILYGLYLLIFETKNRSFYILHSTFSILPGFLLSAFFWLPAYWEGKYTLRDIVTGGDLTDRFVPWQQFFGSKWNYGGGGEFTKQIGLIHWAAVIGSTVLLLKAKERKFRIFVLCALVLFLLSLFIMTASSQPVWHLVTLMQKFQFPWRFLSVSIFISSVLGAIAVTHVPKKLSFLVVFFALGAILINTGEMQRARGYAVRPDSYYSGIFAGTTDTGESSPIWSVRFMEKLPYAQYEIIEGEGRITPRSRSSTLHTFSVDAQVKSRVLDNTLYFPGWNIFVDGKPADIQFQDPGFRGLMTFWAEPGKHSVVVKFEETKLRKTADLISVFGLLLLIGSVTMKAIYSRHFLSGLKGSAL